jgi:hypothetical protein
MGRGQSDALRGLLGALIASRARSPMGMPPGMPGMPPGMPPGMAGTGMFKSVKKGKTMARSKSQMCSDCGEHESNCSCNHNKNERGRKMGKMHEYGSMHKGFVDDTVRSVRSALSNAANTGIDMTSSGLHRLASFVDSLNGMKSANPKAMMSALRSMRSSEKSPSSRSGSNGSAMGAREGAMRSSRSSFNGSAIGAREGAFRSGTGPKTPRYTQSMRDPENPYPARKEKDLENRNSRATSNARNASMKDLHEMIMAGISGKNYAAETKTRNAREDRDMRRANPSGRNSVMDSNMKNLREAAEMRRANPSGRDYAAETNTRNAREARDYGRSQEGRGSDLYNTRSMSTAKRMSKSISSMMSDSVRHMVGGYSASRSGSMSKRARPANNTNTTRNKYGY